MATCPICGKETEDSREFVLNDKKLVNLCALCNSYLICLTKPVSVQTKEAAQKWAKEAADESANQYVAEILNSAYEQSFTVKIKEEAGLPSLSLGDSSSSDSSTALKPVVSTSKANIVTLLVYANYVLLGIVGAIVGGNLGNAFLGIIVGVLIAFISGSVIMMLVEMAENTAINARANLANNALLEEIRDSLKNSQK